MHANTADRYPDSIFFRYFLLYDDYLTDSDLFQLADDLELNDYDSEYPLAEPEYAELDFSDEDEPRALHLDVPYVPTEDSIIEAMFELAEIRPQDLLYDLGCGDGRILVSAAQQFGVHGIGIDMDPARIAEAHELAARCRVEHLTHFVEGDLLEADFSKATVVLLFLFDTVNLRLRPRLLEELRPGTRVVSHTFGMDDWQPDKFRQLGNTPLYKWLVPAPVRGNWQWRNQAGDVYRVSLKQNFQKLSGQAWFNDEAVSLHRTRLTGDVLEISIKPKHTGPAHNFVMRWERNQLQPVGDHGQQGPATRP